MVIHVPYVNVFISSPGDVSVERSIVRRVIDRLPYRPSLQGKIAFNVVDWDLTDTSTAMEASLPPQEAINLGLPTPSECDIVVVILWSRLGTPYRDAEGTLFESGTHWELENALDCPTTKTIIYRGTEIPDLRGEEAPEREAKEKEYKRLQSFLKSDLFVKDSQAMRTVTRYSSPAAFEKRCERDIEVLVNRILEEVATSPQPRSQHQPSDFIHHSRAESWPANKSPFPGLRPFAVDDASTFFGRSRETDELVKRLSSDRFVTVAGASGSGKSSLVAAGLFPRLMANAITRNEASSKNWIYIQFTPASAGSPFESLAAALIPNLKSPQFDDPLTYPDKLTQLASKLEQTPQYLRQLMRHVLESEPEGCEVLLFIDQLEELFTHASEDQISRFANTLADATASGDIRKDTRIRIVATLRADFYHHAVDRQQFARMLEGGTFPLSAPEHDALRLMILRPSERAALNWDKGLVDQILAETGSGTGALALMAYALEELYKLAIQRNDRLMTYANYDQIGGVQGAIGARAEHVFKEANLSEPTLVEAFKRLVRVDTTGKATKCRARFRRDEINQATLSLIDRFVDARLLVMDDDQLNNQVTVEVAHEAVLRQWPRLKEWIEDSQENLISVRQLEEAVDSWSENGENEVLLWSAERVKLAIRSLENLDLKPDPTTEAFMRYSLTPVESPQLIGRPDVNKLLEELGDPTVSSKRLHWIGLWIAHLGDPRSGVGVDDHGVPSISWKSIDRGTVVIAGREVDVLPFQIARYPITNRQFQAFIDASDGWKLDRWWDGLVNDRNSAQRTARDAWFDSCSSAPRESVTWIQAVAFTRWLSAKLFDNLPTGHVIRLPTEWEWKWAASGPQNFLYSYGNHFDSTKANTSDQKFNRTSAVGILPNSSSPFGVDEMSGNVWEWCLNSYRDPFAEDENPDDQRTLKGGAWFSPKDTSTNEHRFKCDVDDWYFYIGFRICLAATNYGQTDRISN